MHRINRVNWPTQLAEFSSGDRCRNAMRIVELEDDQRVERGCIEGEDKRVGRPLSLLMNPRMEERSFGSRASIGKPQPASSPAAMTNGVSPCRASRPAVRPAPVIPLTEIAYKSDAAAGRCRYPGCPECVLFTHPLTNKGG